MADVKWSDNSAFPPAASFDGTEELVGLKSGNNMKGSIAGDLLIYMDANVQLGTTAQVTGLDADLAAKANTNGSNATGTWPINISGNAATVTTNANLTGDVTSVGNATTVHKINTNPLGSTTPTSGNALVANGTQWQSVPVSGDATLNASGALTFNTVNSTPGSFGDATHVAHVVTNAKGQVTVSSSVAISGTPPGGAAGGDLSGTYPNPTVAQINGHSLGDTTPTIANLLIGSATQWVTRPVSGDLTLNGVGNFQLLNVNSTPGTFGDSLNVPQVTVNSKGLVTFVENIPIDGGSPSGPAGGDLSGLYPDPTVSGINTHPLGNTVPTAGNLLVANGTHWMSRPAAPTKTIYVDSEVGLDVVGHGTSLFPYQTITYALSQITDNLTFPYLILAFGSFTETNLYFRPNITIDFQGSSLVVTGVMELDPSYSNGGPFTLKNIYGAKFPAIVNLDYDGLALSTSVLELTNINFASASLFSIVGGSSISTIIVIEDLYGFSAEPAFAIINCYGGATGVTADSIEWSSTSSIQSYNVTLREVECLSAIQFLQNSTQDMSVFMTEVVCFDTIFDSLGPANLNVSSAGSLLLNNIDIIGSTVNFQTDVLYVIPNLSSGGTFTPATLGDSINANYSPTHYTTAGPSVTQNIAGIDTELGNKMTNFPLSQGQVVGGTLATTAAPTTLTSSVSSIDINSSVDGTINLDVVYGNLTVDSPLQMNALGGNLFELGFSAAYEKWAYFTISSGAVTTFSSSAYVPITCSVTSSLASNFTVDASGFITCGISGNYQFNFVLSAASSATDNGFAFALAVNGTVDFNSLQRIYLPPVILGSTGVSVVVNYREQLNAGDTVQLYVANLQTLTNSLVAQNMTCTVSQ